jgi:hypothetical protein
LSVTTKTVAHHVAHILDKLGVSSRLEAAVWVHDCLPEELRSGLDGIGKNSGQK